MRDFSTVILVKSNLTAAELSEANIITSSRVPAPGEHLLSNLVLLILVARSWVVEVTSIILAFIPTCWWAALVALVLGLALRARLGAFLALVLVAGPAHGEPADVAGGEELAVRRRAHAVTADLAHLPAAMPPRFRRVAAAGHGARTASSPANPKRTPRRTDRLTGYSPRPAAPPPSTLINNRPAANSLEPARPPNRPWSRRHSIGSGSRSTGGVQLTRIGTRGEGGDREEARAEGDGDGEGEEERRRRVNPSAY